jgi:hypothetical protein
LFSLLQLIALFVAIVMVRSVPFEGEKGETEAIVDDLDMAELFAKSYDSPKAPKAPKAHKRYAAYGPGPPKAKAPKAPKTS